jgi:heat shock protein HslJ
MRSLSLYVLFGVLISWGSCSSERNALKKVPPISVYKGAYFAELLDANNQPATLMLLLDSSGNFHYFFANSIGFPIFNNVSGKVKPQRDSSYLLQDSSLNSLYFKKESDFAYLIVKDPNSLFAQGKYLVVSNNNKNLLDIQEELLLRMGYYIKAKGKDWEILAKSGNKLMVKLPDMNEPAELAFNPQSISNKADDVVFFSFNIENEVYKVKMVKSASVGNYDVRIESGKKNLKGSGKILNGGIFLNGNWALYKINEKKLSTYKFKDRAPEIFIQDNGKAFFGNNGCNQIFGTLSFTDDEVQFQTPIGSTKMFCEDVDDMLFMEIFSNATNYQLKGSVLTFSSAKGVLEFNKTNKE